MQRPRTKPKLYPLDYEPYIMPPLEPWWVGTQYDPALYIEPLQEIELPKEEPCQSK